ncbi:hypothetical protein [Tenacibaculum adriaticum]|nr:hypothetical protein [Tenacibaculum adriaticum]
MKKLFLKSKEWLDNVQEIHSSGISDPIIGEIFTTKMSYDVTFKDSW